MRLVCHLVTSTSDAAQGGLPETVDRVATHLALEARARVVVYTLERASPGVDGRPYRIEDLSGASSLARRATVGPLRSGKRWTWGPPWPPRDIPPHPRRAELRSALSRLAR